jgi:hypothetical protein
MLSRSPILRFALEVFDHGLANAVSDNPRDWKMAVMSMAQTVELVVKATLVERNVPIYGKDNKTITSHEGLTSLAQLWQQDRINMHARIQVLVDERNSIQHKYGAIDSVTLDYHLDTVFEFLRPLLANEFDLDLDDWIRSEVPTEVCSKVRFVLPAPAVPANDTEKIQSYSATTEFIAAFVAFEAAIRQVIRNAGIDESLMGSSLDLVMKSLGNVPDPPSELIHSVPETYKLRNRIIHGAHAPTREEVDAALPILQKAAEAFVEVPIDVLEKALIASNLGLRGIRWSPDKASPARVASVDPHASPSDTE